MLNYLNISLSKGLKLDTLMLYNKKKTFNPIKIMEINYLNLVFGLNKFFIFCKNKQGFSAQIMPIRIWLSELDKWLIQGGKWC